MPNKKITKKKIIISGIISLVFLISLGFFLFPVRDSEEYTFAKVEKKHLVQTVGEVGSVKSSEEIELNFVQAGTLAQRLVEIGENVSKGQLLAELDYTSLNIQRDEAISNVEAAQSNLDKIVAGETVSGIAVVQAQTEQAKSNYYSSLNNLDKTEKSVAENISQAVQALNDLRSNGVNNVTTFEQAVSSAQASLENTKTTYQQGIDNKKNTLIATMSSKLAVANTALDGINSILTTYSISDQLSSKNTSYLYQTKNNYAESLILLSAANESFDLAKEDSSETNVNNAGEAVSKVLVKTSETLDLCYSALEYSTIPQTALDAYKTTINSEITLVGAGILALEAANQGVADAKISFNTNISISNEALKQAQVALSNAILSAEKSLISIEIDGDKQIAAATANVNSAKEAWEVAKKQLAQLRAPARSEDVSLYEARLKQAQASLDLINKKIEDSTIKSPIKGKVIKIAYEVGEQVSQTKPAISVLAENNFEIEVDISESDISKVTKGALVEITLDAFGEDRIFKGEVDFVEPAETVIQDVIYYKVIIRFSEEEEKLVGIKSGMTANAMITTNEKQNVLVVPSRAIVERNGKKIVRVMVGKKVEEVEVQTGLRGDGGYIEILDNIKEGDLVATFVKEVKKRDFRY